jgi:dUTP pyrophosphatase
MITTLKFAKVRNDAIIPSKHSGDAGYDIYPCFDEDYIFFKPHETKLIPTGICSAFDDDYVMILKERGSTGVHGIGQRSGVIDASFRGEWKVVVTNHNDIPLIIMKNKKGLIGKNIMIDTITDLRTKGLNINWNFTKFNIYPYEKAICQAILIPIAEADVEEYTHDEILEITSHRNEGMLGSSGK